MIIYLTVSALIALYVTIKAVQYGTDLSTTSDSSYEKASWWSDVYVIVVAFVVVFIFWPMGPLSWVWGLIVRAFKKYVL